MDSPLPLSYVWAIVFLLAGIALTLIIRLVCGEDSAVVLMVIVTVLVCFALAVVFVSRRGADRQPASIPQPIPDSQSLDG